MFRLNFKLFVITRSGIQPANLFTIFIVFASHFTDQVCNMTLKDKLSYEGNIYSEVLFSVVRHKHMNKPLKMDHPQYVSQWSSQSRFFLQAKYLFIMQLRHEHFFIFMLYYARKCYTDSSETETQAALMTQKKGDQMGNI